MSNTTLKRRKKVQKKSTRSSKTLNSNIEYSVKTKRKGKSYEFAVVENKERTIKIFKFREKAKEFAEFHNKNQIWLVNGGIPQFLLD